MPNHVDSPGPIHADAWLLDPSVTMLNHGSFGACPAVVLDRQMQLRRWLESEPVHFLMREMPPMIDHARQSLAAVVGAIPENLVFVTNATAGVNSVLRSLSFGLGDEILMTNHGYNACNNVACYVAQRSGALAVTAEIPVPVETRQQVIDALMAHVTERTRIVLLDHVTSPTAIVFPVEEIVTRLTAMGIETLIDGAHAPGMLPLDIERIGATYYAGNCHKWLCTPKGSGFLYVRPERQADIQPTVISHGYNQPRPNHNRFQDAFDWAGTCDPTAWICVDDAIGFLDGLMPGGLTALMERNRHLAIAARRLLSERLGVVGFCGEEMLGSIAAVRLPDDLAPAELPALGRQLFEQFRIEVPVYYWPAAPQRVLRVAAQAYNHLGQYEHLADVLAKVL